MTTVQRTLQRRALALSGLGLVVAISTLLLLAPVPGASRKLLGLRIPDSAMLQHEVGAAWVVTAGTVILGFLVTGCAVARRRVGLVSVLTVLGPVVVLIAGLLAQFGDYRFACGSITEPSCPGMVATAARGAVAAVGSLLALALFRLSLQQAGQSGRG